MPAAKRRADKDEIKATQHASGQARALAETMPRLILEARRIAATVIHGLHGRKRAGPGENFWQYRRFLSGEPARRVDWRRSARDEHLYVREQEWEAAHTVWLWPDRSPSMLFRSQLRLDKSRTVVLLGWGFGGLWFNRRRRIAGVRGVSVVGEIRRSDEIGAVKIFPIKIVGEEEPLLVMDGYFSEESARPLADRVAALLDRPVLDKRES